MERCSLPSLLLNNSPFVTNIYQTRLMLSNNNEDKNGFLKIENKEATSLFQLTCEVLRSIEKESTWNTPGSCSFTDDVLVFFCSPFFRFSSFSFIHCFHWQMVLVICWDPMAIPTGKPIIVYSPPSQEHILHSTLNITFSLEHSRSLTRATTSSQSR